MEHVLFVEKYRPQTVESCILPTRTKAVAQSFVDAGKLPNLLLSGPAGTGKTTLALALCKELDYDWIILNGSNEGRLIDTLRTKVTDFASSISFSGARKIVILDEADYIPETVQAALRNFIEEFSKNCGFIFTCNFPNRIIEPLHSRTTTIDFTIPSDERPSLAKTTFDRVVEILDVEHVEYDKKAVASVVKQFFPDFRRTLNEIQRYSSTGRIDSGILSVSGSTDITDLVKYLSDKDFKEMRKWVATTPNLEMSNLCRKLYDGAYEFVKPEFIPQLVLILADFSYKHSFVADKEINIAAMCTQIMMDVEFK
jgi:DNA polymerase III delta prime subunit